MEDGFGANDEDWAVYRDIVPAAPPAPAPALAAESRARARGATGHHVCAACRSSVSGPPSLSGCSRTTPRTRCPKGAARSSNRATSAPCSQASELGPIAIAMGALFFTGLLRAPAKKPA